MLNRRREKPRITKSKTDSEMANKESFEKLILAAFIRAIIANTHFLSIFKY